MAGIARRIVKKNDLVTSEVSPNEVTEVTEVTSLISKEKFRHFSVTSASLSGDSDGNTQSGRQAETTPESTHPRWTARLDDGREIDVSSTCSLTRDEAIHDAGYYGHVAAIQPEGGAMEHVQEQKREGVVIEARTPAGGAVRFLARDQSHAEWIRSMNPSAQTLAAIRAEDQLSRDPHEPIRCCDCQHRQPTGHPVIIRCGLGRQGPGVTGWWSLDQHECQDFWRAQE